MSAMIKVRQHRLHVSEFLSSVTQSDLENLVSKVCPVVSIYIPCKTATGILRQFAIIVVNCDDAAVQKCIKAFNGSFWKGSKLRIDVAKEYYKDRLAREREEYESSMYQKHLELQQERQVFEIKPAFCEPSIKVRSTRYVQHMIVSTVPQHGGKRRHSQMAAGKIMQCGRKKVFDEDGNPRNEDGVEDEEIPMSELDSTAEKQHKDAALDTGTEISSKNTSSQPSEAPKKAGGGVRVGFGSLLKDVKSDGKFHKSTQLLLRPGTEDDECCVEKATSTSSRAQSRSALAAVLDLDDDDAEGVYGEEEEELATDQNVDEPCMDSADLREEVLAAERSRASAVLAQMLGKGTDASSTKIDTGASAQNSAGSVAVDAAPRDDKARLQSGWGVTAIARYDPTAEDESAFVMTEEERIAILTAKQDESTRRAAAEKARQAKGTGGGDYADTAAFKQMFHKESGVWFGDDGTLEQSVSKGSEALDRLFLEAEMQGIDLRSNTATTAKADSNVMKFSFFDDPALPGDSTGSASFLDNPMDANRNTNPAPRTSNPPPEVLPALTEKERFEQLWNAMPPPMTIEQVILSCRTFCRDKPEEELIKDWKATREKMLLSFKRRRKDAIKHAIAKGYKIGSKFTSDAGIYGPKPGQSSEGDAPAALSSQLSLTAKGRPKGVRGGKRHRTKQWGKKAAKA